MGSIKLKHLPSAILKETSRTNSRKGRKMEISKRVLKPDSRGVQTGQFVLASLVYSAAKLGIRMIDYY